MSPSEAQIRATKKYHQKFERIQIRVVPAEKDTVEQHAESMGESLNSFVRRAIAETMERDKEKASK